MERDVSRCHACRHIVVPAGLVRRADGASIYESEDSIFRADGNEEYYVDDTNLEAARVKRAYVARYCRPGARLLDVGASYGHFLAEAHGQYRATGIEVSPAAVAWGREHFQVDLRVGSVYDLPHEAGDFDAVTFWDVIEHLEQPATAVDEIRRRLKPGGLFFLSTPDAGSLVARAMGSRWHYLDPIQHINLFSRANLTRLLREHGFNIVDSRYFGRSYRVSYVANRLIYLALAKGPTSGPVDRAPSRWFRRWTIPIKLWDVMGIAARRGE